jgi:hypothetical protein
MQPADYCSTDSLAFTSLAITAFSGAMTHKVAMLIGYTRPVSRWLSPFVQKSSVAP